MKKIFALILALTMLSCVKKYESVQYIEYNEYANFTNIDAKSRNFDAIGLIKQSYFTSYTNIKIEDLISAFDKIEWNDFISEDDYMRYIDIIGDKGTNRYALQFKILNQYRWELYSFEINEKSHAVDEASSRLYALYTNTLMK